jgi:hypothetical protein
MSTLWMDRKVGEPRVTEAPGGGYVTVIGAPDWVRLPDALGGKKVKVLGQLIGVCVCGDDHNVTHFELEGEVGVAECERIGFAWYMKEKKP